jgi:D-alanyl-D-alanine carboxypeptidase
MQSVNSGARSGLRYCLLASAAVAAALTINSDVADARRHHHYSHTHHAHAGRGHHRHARLEDYSPPFASIVIDGNSGAVLQGASADSLRHPASLTKVMTLYLLFERLEAGRIRLDSPLKISEHAAGQAPTKLALKPGQTITVEDALKGMVTKSANDAAVAVAESLAGDEGSFANIMTQKAHALGMTHTKYVNASGLPDDDQVTTARDQALLGRAIQERFPRYYKYFSTQSFVYHGEAMRNHNHLLGAVDGVDGIKTGFTHASGFNLLTSLHRDGRYLVAVVMGGPSAAERDERMRELISTHIKEAAVRRTAPMIAEVAERRDASPAKLPTARPDRTPTPDRIASADRTPTASVDARAVTGSNDPIRPVLVKTISYRTAPVQTASLTPMPALVAVAAQPAAPQPVAAQAAPVPQSAPLPQAAPVPQAVPGAQAAPPPQAAASVQPAGRTQPATPAQAATRAISQPRAEIASAAPSVEVKAIAPTDAPAPPMPTPVFAKTADPAPVQAQQAQQVQQVQQAKQVQPVQSEPVPGFARVAAAPRTAPLYSPPPTHVHGGWLIQIGAFDDEDQAKQHLTAAQIRAHATLAAKDPFTERVQKGDKELYRARFAGFDKSTAEAACRMLKRSDFECMALKN